MLQSVTGSSHCWVKDLGSGWGFSPEQAPAMGLARLTQAWAEQDNPGLILQSRKAGMWWKKDKRRRGTTQRRQP